MLCLRIISKVCCLTNPIIKSNVTTCNAVLQSFRTYSVFSKSTFYPQNCVFITGKKIITHLRNCQAVCFSSSVGDSNGRTVMSALSVKKRIPRKKLTIKEEELLDKTKYFAVAYSSAEEYDLNAVDAGIKKQGLYRQLPLPTDADEVLYVTANYQVEQEPRHIYFFSEGSVVFWNVPDIEQKAVLQFLKPYQINSYDEHLIFKEKDDLEYLYSEDETKFSEGRIIFNSGRETHLETYAVSNGLAHSVKLAIWEATLENFEDTLKSMTKDMKQGKVKMSRNQLFKIRGEFLELQNFVNLFSDLLDPPDFYWDRQELELLYQQICNYLNVSRRIRVMNQRLSCSSEMIDLLTNHMNNDHHVRLELMIIALILIEVLFELPRFIRETF